MSIKVRLVFGLSMLLALMFSQAIIAIDQIGRLTRTTNEVAGRGMTRVEQVSRINTALAELRGAELGYILSLLPKERERYLSQINTLWQDVNGSIEQYRGLIGDPKRLADYEAFLLHIDDYQKVDRELMNLSGDFRREQAQAYFAASQKGFDEMLYHIHRLRFEEFTVSQQLSSIAINAASRTRYLFLLGALMVSVVEVGLGYYIFRSLSGGLSSLVEGTRRVSQGDLSQAVPVAARDELGELARAFNAMMVSVRTSQEENLRLSAESLQMREERIQLLRDTLVRVVRAQEEERKRVARELHDQAGQSLTALQLGLAQLEREATSTHAKEQVAGLRSLTVETMEEIRNLALNLRPSALDELGLIPALRGYTRDLSRRLGIPIELEVHGTEKRFPAEMEVTLFRVIQEGLTNIAKHSQAKRAKVTLRIENSAIQASVRDDGVGFNMERVLHSRERHSLGLFGIQERVELLGGKFEVTSQAGQGTELRISLPFPEAEKERHEQNKSVAGG